MSTVKMWAAAGQLGAWIPCPSSPMSSSSVSASTETQLLNGGAFVVKSAGHHRKYDMNWVSAPLELQPIKDMFTGLYGPGPFYFIDPSILNLMPPHWAAPQLTASGQWPSLVKGVVPTIGTTAITSGATPPPQQATYALPATAPIFVASTPRILLPIPPGFNLNLRFWGAITGTARIRVNAYNRSTGVMTATDFTPAALGAPATYTGNTYSHVEVWVTKTSSTTSTITLACMLATISATSSTPSLLWSPGQGNSGVQFVGDLTHNVYRTWGSGWHSLSASLVEVGSWVR